MKSDRLEYKIFRGEVKRIADSKSMIFLLIILPAVLFTFISLIYQKGVVREIPVGVLNNSTGEISTIYINMIESTGNLKIVNQYNDISEIKKSMLNGNIMAAIIIPENFEEDIKGGKGSTVTVLNNTCNLISSNTVLKDITTFTKTLSGGVLLKKLKLKGLQENTAHAIINPVRIDTQPLYNPNYNYLTYLLPGLIPALFQMIIMLTASMIFNSGTEYKIEREYTGKGLKQIFSLLAGKMLPYILIDYTIGAGIIGIIYPLCNINPSGVVIDILLIFILFITGSFFTGALISVIFKNVQAATEAVLFINTAAFIFSGFVFPLRAMPELHNTFAQIMPFTHFMDAFIKIYFMNADINYAGSETVKLLIFIVVPIALILPISYFRIKKSNAANN